MQDNNNLFPGVATMQCITDRHLLLPGNIIPHQWYKSLTIKGCPDLVAITILADLVAWWRNSNKVISSKDYKHPDFSGNSLSLSYEYLHDKFGFNKETARKALVRLEQANTLSRYVKNIKHVSGSNFNRLFVVINQKFYKSCFRSPEYDVRISDGNDIKPKRHKGFSTTNYDTFGSPLNSGDHISNNKNLNYRSNESNFVENNLEERKRDKLSESKTTGSFGATDLIDKVKAKFLRYKRKTMLEYHPLTEEEAKDLRISSGREFNLNYINKLIKKLGEKYPEHKFYTKASFLKYLSKVLSNELRRESVVNNEGFNFKQDKTTARIEEYLRDIEESKATDKITQLKKKIAARFDNELSYKILTACRFKERLGNTNNFQIYLVKEITLSKLESSNLLEEVRAVFGNEINELQFNFQPSFHLPLQSPDDVKPHLNLGKEGTIWHKASKELLEFYGEDIHRSWFSKLEAIESSTRNYLILKAPSDFFKNYIESNFLSRIKSSISLFNITLKNLEIVV